jgi:hypothetical protein
VAAAGQGEDREDRRRAPKAVAVASRVVRGQRKGQDAAGQVADKSANSAEESRSESFARPHIEGGPRAALSSIPNAERTAMTAR